MRNKIVGIYKYFLCAEDVLYLFIAIYNKYYQIKNTYFFVSIGEIFYTFAPVRKHSLTL